MLCRCSLLSPGAAQPGDTHPVPAGLSSCLCGESPAPHELCWSICISAFLPQLPGAHPSRREHLGGGRGDGGGSDEKAGEMGQEAPGARSCWAGAVRHLKEEQERNFMGVDPPLWWH